MLTPLKITKCRMLRFIHDFQSEHGYPPSVMQITGAVGLRKEATTYSYLRMMVREGMLAKRPDPGAAWQILVSVPPDGGCDETSEGPVTARRLSELDIRLLHFIHDFQEQHRYRPTIREMLKAASARSTGTVLRHLQGMTAAGALAPLANRREPYHILIDLPELPSA